MIKNKEVTYSCDLCGKEDILLSNNICSIKEQGNIRESYVTLCEDCLKKLTKNSFFKLNNGETISPDEFYDMMISPSYNEGKYE